MTLAKLQIFKVTSIANKSSKTYRVDLSKFFICQFNPTEFQLEKRLQWQTKPSKGEEKTKTDYVGSTGQNMSLKFLFDVTGANGPKVMDVAVVAKYAVLKELASLDPATIDRKQATQGEPPWVHVQWGAYISFPAVITQFTERFLVFSPEGLPLRAEVTISLNEVEGWTWEGQNPTSASEARKTYVVQRGDRLDRIAYEEYGDTAAWRHLAQTNNISDPKVLTPGQILRIVPLG